MHRIGVVGLSWRRGGPEAIARFALCADERARDLGGLARELGLDELVLLATCNRVELAFVPAAGVPIEVLRRRAFAALAGRPGEPGEAERTLRAWAGEGAAEHVLLVAAGLDSATLGETEISGQVRDALEAARAQGTVGARLGRLYDEALKVARAVRNRTGLGAGRTSLAEIALERIAARPGPVALLGVSPMTRRCALSLGAEGRALVFVNRTVEHARELCAELALGDAPVRSLAAFRADPDPVAAIVCATSAPEPVLGRAELSRLARCNPTPLLVDMALPPDVDAAAARELGLERVGLDEITAQAARSHERRTLEAAEARAVVDEALERMRRRAGGRALDAALAVLQRHYVETARAGVERLVARELSGIDAAQRAALARFAETLAKRLAHLPTRGLREVASELGPRALEAFFCAAEGELERELSAAIDAGQVLAELEAIQEDAP